MTGFNAEMYEAQVRETDARLKALNSETVRSVVG